jgi:hypothetical protein
VLALALLLAPGVAAAQMYKCVDERGVTTYSDKPRPGCKGGAVDIQPSPPLSGSLQTPNEDLKGQEADFKRRQAAREREEKQERAALKQRCAAARSEHARLSTARRVAYVDSKGERVYVEDDARDKRLAELRRQLASCP